jgi:hypothetical protein
MVRAEATCLARHRDGILERLTAIDRNCGNEIHIGEFFVEDATEVLRCEATEHELNALRLVKPNENYVIVNSVPAPPKQPQALATKKWLDNTIIHNDKYWTW